MPRLIATAAVVMISSAAAMGRGQQPSNEAASAPAFAAVSIQSSASGLTDFRFLPNRIVARAVTLSQLIEQAYGQAWGVVGGPDWVRFDLFNVTATTGEEVSRDRMTLMLQSLLADRFQLQLTREMQTGTTYRLTAGRVHHLTPAAKPNSRSGVAASLKENFGVLSYDYDGRNATMGALALTLSRQLRAPVIDETKLTGHYDFRINFTYDDAFGHRECTSPDVPTIFTALEKQLGLKLAADESPIPVYVIRRVSRPSQAIATVSPVGRQ